MTKCPVCRNELSEQSDQYSTWETCPNCPYTRRLGMKAQYVEQDVRTGEIVGKGEINIDIPTVFNTSGSKYLRKILTVNGHVDVYAVLIAFKVICPARQHAIKKLLCSGLRDKGDTLQDLKEARDAIDRAIQLKEAHKVKELE